MSRTQTRTQGSLWDDTEQPYTIRLTGDDSNKKPASTDYTGKIHFSNVNKGKSSLSNWSPKTDAEQSILNTLYTSESKTGTAMPKSLMDLCETRQSDRITFVPRNKSLGSAIFSVDWTDGGSVTSRVLNPTIGTRAERKAAKRAKKAVAAQRKAAAASSSELPTAPKSTKRKRKSKYKSTASGISPRKSKATSRVTYIWEDPTTGEDSGYTRSIRPTETGLEDLSDASTGVPAWLLPTESDSRGSPSFIRYFNNDLTGRGSTYDWDNKTDASGHSHWTASTDTPKEVRSRIKHMTKIPSTKPSNRSTGTAKRTRR